MSRDGRCRPSPDVRPVVAAVRTIFMGSGAFGLPSLARLHASDEVELVAVVTAAPRPAGRRALLQPTPVADAATGLGVAILTPTRLRDAEAQAQLAGLGPGLIVLADYGRLVPPDVLHLPEHGALNLHPSLLPRHRGAAPVPAAILAGDATTGVTLMRMDEGLDTGPIISQVSLPLHGDETAPGLESRLAEMAADLLEASLPAWLAGRLEARPQPTAGATLTRPLRREDGRLDPQRPAAALERQVRAYQPWPGAYLELDGGRLIVWSASNVESWVAATGTGEASEGRAPGSLVPHEDGLALVTADGDLLLREVQPAGKRRMSGAEYRRGRRI